MIKKYLARKRRNLATNSPHVIGARYMLILTINSTCFHPLGRFQRLRTADRERRRLLIINGYYPEIIDTKNHRIAIYERKPRVAETGIFEILQPTHGINFKLRKGDQGEHSNA